MKSFDISTLNTTIPHDKLKNRLASIIRNSFIFKNGNSRNKYKIYLVLGHEETFVVKEHSDSKNKYSGDDIIKMLEFLIDNIFVVFYGKGLPADSRHSIGNKLYPSSCRHIFYWSRIYTVFALNRQETVGISVQLHIDSVLSINNPDFENYMGQMYPIGLGIKNMTESNTSAAYQDLHLSTGRDGQLYTSIYDKRNDFNFHIINFPFLRSNIPASSAYGVFISQLIQCARACSSYGCFNLRVTRLSNKLLEQGHVKERLKSSLKNFLVDTGILSSNMKFLSHEC